MNLDDLINISSAPQVIEETQEDIIIAAKTYIGRLSSPSINIVSDSFVQLTELLQQNFEVVKPAIQPALNIISSTPNSLASVPILYFLTEAFIKKNDILTEQNIILILEAIRIISTTKSSLKEIFTCGQTISQSDYFNSLQFEDYSLSTFIIQIISYPHSQNLVKSLLQRQLPDTYLTQQNTKLSGKILTNLINQNIIQSILKQIEQDQVQTDFSAQSITFIAQLINKELVPLTPSDQLELQKKIHVQLNTLADFYHAASYHIVNQIQQNLQTNPIQLIIIENLTKIFSLQLKFEQSLTYIENSKIFNYLTLVIAVLNNAIYDELLLHSLQIVHQITQQVPTVATKLAITQIQLLQVDFASVLTKIYAQKQGQTKDLALLILGQILNNNEISKIAFLSALSREIRTNMRGNVSSGLKIIAKSFIGSKSIQQTPLNDLFTTYAKSFKQDILSLKRADFEVQNQSVIDLISLLVEGDFNVKSLLEILLDSELASTHFAISCLKSAQNAKILENLFVQNVASVLFGQVQNEAVLRVFVQLVKQLKGKVIEYAVCGFKDNFELFLSQIQWLVGQKTTESALILAVVPGELGVEIEKRIGIVWSDVRNEQVQILRNADFGDFVVEVEQSVEVVTKEVKEVNYKELYDNLLVKYTALEAENQVLKDGRVDNQVVCQKIELEQVNQEEVPIFDIYEDQNEQSLTQVNNKRQNKRKMVVE